MPIPERDVMFEVNMKADRARHHLDALNGEIARWLALPNVPMVREYANFDKGLQVFRADIGAVPKEIPLRLGEFISCLRTSLEWMAWGLAHLDRKRIFTDREERNISFLIFKPASKSTYDERRGLFPTAVAEVFDDLQPYLRGDAYRDDLLWQLDELWRMDKHRSVPTNSTVLTVALPGPPETWRRYVRNFDDHLEVHFPLFPYASSEVHLKPIFTLEVLFGERMGDFQIPPERLNEINQFVRDDVIPRFAGFFP